MNLKYLVSKLDQSIWGLSIYFTLGFIVYFNLQGASFVDDSIESFIDFETQGWRGFLHSYDFSSIYYFHDLISIICFELFGHNNYLWYLMALILHSSSCYFFYRFIQNILKYAEINFAKEIAFFSSILFLVGAYNCENIFWIATYHYQFSVLYFSVGLYYISQKKSEFSRYNFIKLFIPFVPMLTMHELVFIFPFAFFCTWFYFNQKFNFRKILLFLLPFGLSEIVILGLTKYIKGSFIPHYGVEHLQNHSLYSFFYTLYQYTIKLIFLIHNYEYQIREKIYDVSQLTMIFIFSIVFVSICLFVYYNRNNKLKINGLSLLSILLILFFLPVSNMYFMWHFPIQNDRLGYFLSIFLFAIFIFILFDVLGKKLATLIVLFFIISNVYFLRKNIGVIQHAIIFSETTLKNSYDYYKDKNPYILNLPFNYKGFYIYRKKHRLNSARRFYDKQEIEFNYVASMPFNSLSDSVLISKINDSTFNMRLVGDGWFMYNDVGASDYETEKIKFNVDEWNKNALIILKNYKSVSPILYCTGNRGFVELK